MIYKTELFKLILEKGKIDKDVFKQTLFVVDCPEIIEIFRVLQEIDNSIPMFFLPIDMECLSLTAENKIKKSNAASIFTTSTSTLSHLTSTRRNLKEKLIQFFKIIRYHPIDGQIIEMYTRRFIDEFAYEKALHLENYIK